MRVIVPTTHTYPEVYDALMEGDRPFDSIPVGESDRAYCDLLTCLWGAGESFAIVEHDIVVNAETLDELAVCDHDWCGFPFQYGLTLTYGLGCAKFSAELIERVPDAMRRVAVMYDDRHPKRHWCRLDAWLTTVLESEGEVRHRHQPAVTHLNHHCSHGCTNLY